MAAKAKDKRRDEQASHDKSNGAGASGAAAPKKAKGKKAGKVKPKPKGLRWVSPYLTVRDVDASIAWYERAFGFKSCGSMPGPDGKPIHAELRHKKATIFLGPESQSVARAPGKEGTGVCMYCYCEDVDALAASARAAGGKILEEPQDQFWGDRTCFIVDPDGHHWMFATHKFDMDPDAMAAPECAAAEGEGKPETAKA